MAAKADKKALIVWGGMAFHEPQAVAEIFARELRGCGFDVTVSDTLESFEDAAALAGYDLIVPHWTAGQITDRQLQSVLAAVAGGTGIAGVHGGMGDSFRHSPAWHYMAGGLWVAHPGDIITYHVDIVDHADAVTADLESFDVESEQYYMLVDPSSHVLATTTFAHNGCTMPVAWKRTWGKGRVYYCSLGHVAKEFEMPQVLTLAIRGMLWAAGVTP